MKYSRKSAELVARFARALASCAVAAVLATGSAALAQVDDDPIIEWEKRQNADERLRAYGTDLLGDGIDPHTGAISFQHTDVDLPGNSHLEVAVRRKISQGEFYHKSDAQEFADWQLDVPRIHALHGANGFSGNRCSNDFGTAFPLENSGSSVTPLINFEYSDGVVLEAPGGQSIQLLEVSQYNTLGPQWPSGASHISTEGWWFECITASDGGQGFRAHAPNGDVYTLDKVIVHRGNPLGSMANTRYGRTRTLLAASRVTDVSGNYVDYSYDGLGRLTRIEANDGRRIDLNYSGSNKYISSVTANGRTWTYSYSTSSFNNPSYIGGAYAPARLVLDGVTRPDGRSWVFDLDAMEARPGPGGFCDQVARTISVTHPTGVSGVFQLRENRHRMGNITFIKESKVCPPEASQITGGGNTSLWVGYFETMAVISKSLSGPGIPTYVWSFDYQNSGGRLAGSIGPDDIQFCEDGAADPASECTNWTKVQEPDGRHITYYHFWNAERFGGKLARMEVRDGDENGPLLERRTLEYHLEGAVGISFAAAGPGPRTTLAPAREIRSTTERNGDTFTVESTYVTDQSAANYSWGNPTRVERSTSLSAATRIVETTYEHKKPIWVLGLPKTVRRNGTLFDDYDYDSLGRVRDHNRFGSFYMRYAYHGSSWQRGRVQWRRDALGNMTTYNNYRAGIPRAIGFEDNTSISRAVDYNGWVLSETDENGDTIGFEYNPMGWLTKVKPPTNDGPWADTDISYVFNSGGVEQTITKSNLETTVQYDGMLRPVLETRRDTAFPSAITHTRTEFDSQGRPTFQSLPAAAASAPDGVSTEYDALGRLTRTAQNVAPFAVTTTEYLPGYRVKVTDPRGFATSTDYLAFGAPAQAGPQSQGEGAPAWERDLLVRVDAPLGADLTMSYDNFGNVLTETMGSATTSYLYNARNLVERVTDPDGHYSYTYYDLNDQPIVTVDGAGRQTRMVYDDRNRPRKIIRAWAGNSMGTGATLDCAQMRADTAADPVNNLQQCYQSYAYTPAGQIDTVEDANGNRTKYAYDAHSRLTHVYFPSKTTTGQHSTTDYEQTTYNALGQQVAKRTRRGDVIDYTHDALGRLVDRHVPGAPTHTANGRTVTHSYTHNAFGHVLTATHDSEIISYAYDGVGRVTSQDYDGLLTVGYQWDAANNLTKLTWPDGFGVDYVWDANNRVTKAMDGGRVLADVAYDALSRRSAVVYANGTNVTHAYSSRGDLTDHNHMFAGALVNYDFTYNGVGQTLSRLVSDPSYGWSSPSSGTETYAVNGLNQYTSIDGASPAYDGNGNLTTDHRGRSFSYDAENVLRTVTGLAAGAAYYHYHADGSRRSKTYNGVATRFFYMGGLGYLDEADTAFAADQEIAEYTDGSVLLRRYVRLPGSIDEAFLMIDVSGGAPVETWAHADRLGSVIATTDSAGAVTDKYRYSPYGKPGAEGAGGFPFRYTGQKLDPETGLYYYKARYYDPDTGRFLQVDPIGYADQMNLYAYVGNDPVNLADPSGMCSKASFCKSYAGPAAEGMRGASPAPQTDSPAARPGPAANDNRSGANDNSQRPGGKRNSAGRAGAAAAAVAAVKFAEKAAFERAVEIANQTMSDTSNDRQHNIFYHYSDYPGSLKIGLTQQIMSSDGRAYVTIAQFGPETAQNSLFNGADHDLIGPGARRGSYVTIVGLDIAYPLTPDPSTRDSGGFYSHGSIRNGRGATFLYNGANYFSD